MEINHLEYNPKDPNNKLYTKITTLTAHNQPHVHLPAVTEIDEIQATNIPSVSLPNLLSARIINLKNCAAAYFPKLTTAKTLTFDETTHPTITALQTVDRLSYLSERPLLLPELLEAGDIYAEYTSLLSANKLRISTRITLSLNFRTNFHLQNLTQAGDLNLGTSGSDAPEPEASLPSLIQAGEIDIKDAPHVNLSKLTRCDSLNLGNTSYVKLENLTHITNRLTCPVAVKIDAPKLISVRLLKAPHLRKACFQALQTTTRLEFLNAVSLSADHLSRCTTIAAPLVKTISLPNLSTIRLLDTPNATVIKLPELDTYETINAPKAKLFLKNTTIEVNKQTKPNRSVSTPVPTPEIILSQEQIALALQCATHALKTNQGRINLAKALNVPSITVVELAKALNAGL